MSNLAIKDVSFMGSDLRACQNAEDKKVYVGVSWICNGLGMSKNLKDTQIKKIQSDLVLNRGCVKFDAGVFDENNDVLALDIEFLAIWLAKITLTPKMQKEYPELVEKLIEYQLKAKDVLANAFVNQVPQLSMEDALIQSLIQMKETRLKQEEHDRKIAQMEIKQEKHEQKVNNVLDFVSKAPDFKVIEQRINTYSRRTGKPQSQVWGMIYKKLEELHGVDTPTRVRNAKKKIQDERASQNKAPYSQSTLSKKVKGTSIIQELKLEQSVIEILMVMTNELD